MIDHQVDINTTNKIVQTYVSRPKNDEKPKTAVILISDVFGVAQNSMLLADDFAANGYLTLLPDILDGEFLPLDVFETGSVDIPAWASRHGPEQVDPVIEKIIGHLRNELGVEKIASAGYCFGGKVRLMGLCRLSSVYLNIYALLNEFSLC